MDEMNNIVDTSDDNDTIDLWDEPEEEISEKDNNSSKESDKNDSIIEDGAIDSFEDIGESEDNSSDKIEETRDKAVELLGGLILYVIIDKEVYGLLNYLRESGLNVSNVFTDVGEAKDTVLMQANPTRIVIIDTGMGKFTATAIRAEIIDLLGIAGENNRITVFYTDSVIKADTNRALGKLAKGIDWIPYKSTSICAATIINYRENYLKDYDYAEDEVALSEKEISRFVGDKFIGEEQTINVELRLPLNTISKTVEQIDGFEQLESFKIKI